MEQSVGPFTLFTNVGSIYRIICNTTGESYIGSSINPFGTIRQGRIALILGKHNSKPLQAAFKEHGAAAFEWEIVETCEAKKLSARKKFWIKHYKELGGVFNVHLTKEKPLSLWERLHLLDDANPTVSSPIREKSYRFVFKEEPL